MSHISSTTIGWRVNFHTKERSTIILESLFQIRAIRVLAWISRMWKYRKIQTSKKNIDFLQNIPNKSFHACGNIEKYKHQKNIDFLQNIRKKNVKTSI